MAEELTSLIVTLPHFSAVVVVVRRYHLLLLQSFDVVREQQHTDMGRQRVVPIPLIPAEALPEFRHLERLVPRHRLLAQDDAIDPPKRERAAIGLGDGSQVGGRLDEQFCHGAIALAIQAMAVRAMPLEVTLAFAEDRSVGPLLCCRSVRCSDNQRDAQQEREP